jgi:hypothetical protein
VFRVLDVILDILILRHCFLVKQEVISAISFPTAIKSLIEKPKYISVWSRQGTELIERHTIDNEEVGSVVDGLKRSLSRVGAFHDCGYSQP